MSELGTVEASDQAQIKTLIKLTIIFLLKSSTARQNCKRLTPPFFFRYCKRNCFRLQIVNPIILPIKIRLGIIKMNMMMIVKPVGKDKAMLCL